MHAHNERLPGAHDDHTLRRLSLLLTAALEEGRISILVIHLTTGECILLPGAHETRAGNGVQRRPSQKGCQLFRLLGGNSVAGRACPQGAIVADNRRVLSAGKEENRKVIMLESTLNTTLSGAGRDT